MSDFKTNLKRLNKKYQGKDDILGKNLLTMANGINSSRALMHAQQFDQIVNLKEPEIAGVITNYENLVGKYSSAYYKAKSSYRVIDKIVKYPDKKGSIYTLIIKNTVTNEYDIITKKPGVILTETYGYKFNNKALDELEVGDTIEKGDVLYRSTSFDDDMNYRLGVNAKTLYTLHPLTIEDAIVISESLAKRLISIEYDKVYISLNDNDILLLIYGDKNERKCFADIGEEIKDATLAVKRRIDYSHAFFDLKEENMRKILASDTPYYIPFSKDKIVDISIYSNKDIEDIPDTYYNKQILEYMRMEATYNKRLKKKLGRIIQSSKKKYSDDLAEMYARMSRIVDPEYKWSDQGKNVFGNMIIEFFVEKEVGVVVGSKLCGRYGDKGVISAIVPESEMQEGDVPIKIVPDEEMPITESGVRVEMIVDILGVGNRLNGKQLNEVELNAYKDRVIRQSKELGTTQEKHDHLFKFIRMVNEEQYENLEKYYSKLSDYEKEYFIKDMEENSFTLIQNPMYGNLDLDGFDRIATEFNIEPENAYVYKFGRKIKMMNKVIVGDKYVYKLKHHKYVWCINSFNCWEELIA